MSHRVRSTTRRRLGIALMEIVAALFVFGVLATLLTQMIALSLSFQQAVDEQRRLSAAATELLEECAAGPFSQVTPERLNERTQQVAEELGFEADVTATVRELPADEVAASGLAARELRVVISVDGRWPIRVEQFTICHALTEAQP